MSFAERTLGKRDPARGGGSLNIAWQGGILSSARTHRNGGWSTFGIRQALTLRTWGCLPSCPNYLQLYVFESRKGRHNGVPLGSGAVPKVPFLPPEEVEARTVSSPERGRALPTGGGKGVWMEGVWGRLVGAGLWTIGWRLLSDVIGQNTEFTSQRMNSLLRGRINFSQ